MIPWQQAHGWRPAADRACAVLSGLYLCGFESPPLVVAALGYRTCVDTDRNGCDQQEQRRQGERHP